jgi:hypothetical protein
MSAVECQIEVPPGGLVYDVSRKTCADRFGEGGPGIWRGLITVREINVGKAAFAMITRNRFNVHRHCRDLL